METFKRRVSDSVLDLNNIGVLSAGGDLSASEQAFLSDVVRAWNFYEGYHWEGIDDLDGPQVTINYCRAFVNKFVAFEFGKGFSIKTPPELEREPVTVGDPKKEIVLDKNENHIIEPEEVIEPEEKVVVSEKTLADFLDEVWGDNKRDELLTEIGQTKSVSGEAWVKVSFESREDLVGDDPFEEYPNGRIRLTLTPTQYVYPRFDDHDRNKLVELLIIYPIHRAQNVGGLFSKFSRNKLKTVLYKQIWTKSEVVCYEDDQQTESYPNPYGFIPFVQIKNFIVAGETRGVGDLEDLIPLNVELNTKRSDVSEVIDYHAAPITLVYGAKIGNLEKGANKVWGGLPKDSKVENLALQGDLVASTTYIRDIKTAMCEVGGIPETVLGGASAISNTSGVALQYMNLPLIERTRVKRACTCAGLQLVNKMILFVALKEGLIEKPADVSMKDFVRNTVELPDTLPKDGLVELQKIQQEMSIGIECRHGALERMGHTTNIEKKLAEIDKERQRYPELFNPALQQLWYQSRQQPQMGPTNAGGMLNGQTPAEQTRIAMTGQNGGAEV